MSKLLLTFALTLIVSLGPIHSQAVDTLSAPRKESLFERAFYKLEDLLDLRDMNRNYDTLYIARAPKGLKLRLSLKSYGSDIIIKGVHQGYSYRADMEAKNKYTLSMSANYRGLALSLALNPAKWAGWNKDFELTVNAYGNKIGADIVYQTANTFKGNMIVSDNGDEIAQASMGVVSQDLLLVNAYYVFNGRHYSYPAAFGQTWLQLRSSGSVMVGVSFLDRKLTIGEIEEFGNDPFSFTTLCIGVGVGYAYNFVLRKGWLLHLSVLPELVVRNRSHINAAGENTTMSTRFPELINIGRISATRHFGRYFMGLNSVVNFSSIGDREVMEIQNLKWQAFLFVGVQL